MSINFLPPKFLHEEARNCIFLSQAFTALTFITPYPSLALIRHRRVSIRRERSVLSERYSEHVSHSRESVTDERIFRERV